ncbi:hypothetical protein [Chromobacterium sp. IIBBL 290-4]|uniref:hypothetical protein n=1 Tax=Chromobacterium sp. IIBBL 290-4 TaxID=2953890 RepID=UPI0020B6C308|nr:hypothetical protein [Chromobacterium sp. IIBBL 290-4]UTH74130.1 hypothetical protein NKT35_21720 [Chromobacterium sp. IIBBL 290-4]
MRRKQKGELLVTLAIAVALIGMCLAYLGVRQVNEWRVARGQILGGALAELGKGVNSYVVRFHPQIADAWINHPGAAQPLIVDGASLAADVTHPTAAEIARIAGLSGFGDKPPVPGGSYRIALSPAGGSCLVMDTCNVNALTYVDKPLLLPYPSVADNVDYVAAAAAAQIIGQNGGVALLPDKSKLQFPDGPPASMSMKLDNPVANQGGIVAVRGGYLRSDLDMFLRRDGSRPMTGNLNMDRFDIKGSGALRMGDVFSTNGVNAGNDVHAGRDLTVDRSASIAGSADVQGGLKVGDRISAGEYVQLSGVREGDPCQSNGLIAMRAGEGTVLSCVGGRWGQPGFSETSTESGAVEACGFNVDKRTDSQVSVAYCKPGFRLLSGGYYVTRWPNFLVPGQPERNYKDFTFAPEESAPLSFYDVPRPSSDQNKSRQEEHPIDLSVKEGWYIWTGAAENGCWKAVATCVR